MDKIRLGDIIKQVNEKNKNDEFNKVLGVAIEKEFMPSVANLIGTDLKKYNILRKNRFAFNPMHVGRDEKIPIALYKDESAALVSPAYTVFEIKKDDVCLEYLNLIFKSKKFDHICWFHTDASVRGGLSWDDFCDIEIKLPDKEIQKQMVEKHKLLKNRINVLEKENNLLENYLVYKFGNMFHFSEDNDDIFGNYVSFMQGNQIDTEFQYEEKEENMERFLRIIDYTSNGKEVPRYIIPPSNATYISKDEICIVRYGSLGTICRRFDGIIANNLFKIIPEKIINNNYIYYFLLQPKIQHLIKNSESSSVMSAIKHSTISELPMTSFTEESLNEFSVIANETEKIILKNLDEINLINEMLNIMIKSLI